MYLDGSGLHHSYPTQQQQQQHQRKDGYNDTTTIRNISNIALSEITSFCENNPSISICKSRQDAETFRHDFVVGFFDDDNALLSDIAALNSDPVKRALRNFFLTAHDHMIRFQFVGLYFYRDMAAWSKMVLSLANNMIQENRSSYEPDEDEDDDNDDITNNNMETEENGIPSSTDPAIYDIYYSVIADNLPFGVIPIGDGGRGGGYYGQYSLVEDKLAMKKTIIFTPTNPTAAQIYQYKVIDNNARFIDVDNYHSTSGDVAPISPFTELFKEYELIREAETQIMDYNSMQVYREEYAIAIPQPDAPIGSLSDQQLYNCGVNSILGVKQMDNIERESMAMKNAQRNINRLIMEGGNNSRYNPSDFGQPTVGAQRILDNRRPQRTHFLKHIPQSVQIPNTSHSEPTHNINEMRSKYDNDVCSIMALPFIFYKPYGAHHHSGIQSSSSNGSNGGRESTSKLEFSQKLLDDEISSQHKLFNEFFREVYRNTFSKLKMGQARIAIPNNNNRMATAGILFDNVIVKSDESVDKLLPYYHAGIIDAGIIRKFLYQNYGIKDRDPEEDPKNPNINNNNNNNNNNRNKNKKNDGGDDDDDDDDDGDEEIKEKSKPDKKKSGSISAKTTPKKSMNPKKKKKKDADKSKEKQEDSDEK